MAVRKRTKAMLGRLSNSRANALDLSTVAYVAACVAAGYTPDATFTADIDRMIKGLKSGFSPWSNYDIIMPLAVPDTRCVRDIKDPSRTLNVNNSPTFTADRGYTGNGTNAYMSFNPGYNPGAGGNLLTQNDMHLGVYALTQSTTGNYAFGTVLSNTIRVRARADANSASCLANTSGVASVGTQAMPRHIVGLRRESTTARIFSEGVQNNTLANTSSALSSFAWGIFRTNNADYSDAQLAFVHAGKAHSNDQALQEHNVMKVYLQARGAVA